MFRGEERGRAFGALGTTVGMGTALGPLVGGALIALGGPDLGWRLVFFVNIPVGIAVILLARRFLPQTPATGRHRLDVIGSLMLGTATFCVLFGAVESDLLGRSVVLLVIPTGAAAAPVLAAGAAAHPRGRGPAGRPAAVPAPVVHRRRACWRSPTSPRWPDCRWCSRSTSSVGWASAPCTPRSA